MADLVRTQIRSRMYALIDALENDLRDLMSEWLVGQLSLDDLFADALEDAKQRAKEEDQSGVDATGLLNYLHLGQEIGILNRNRELLPSGIAESIRGLTPRIETIIPIRNRVMHGRPLTTDDPEQLRGAIEAILQESSAFDTTNEIMIRLRGDPTWSPLGYDIDKSRDQVIHNIPLPDYDETGLIGRRTEVRDLLGRLKERRESVITVIGTPGVGKTALAIEVLYKLIDDPECPFEAVLWASLKTERLTSEGISKITGVATDLMGIVTSLAEPLGAGSADVDLLASVLADSDTLIVIDNLETADSNEIVRLYDSLPSSVSFLFTSRVGLGQLERRIRLDPLDKRDAGFLLRKYAERRNQEQLSSLPDDAVNRIVGRVNNIPLGIKWFVNAIEVGEEPEAALADRGDFLAYCVRVVSDSLTDKARTLAFALSSIGRPASFAELMILTDYDSDALRQSLQELQRASFVIVRAQAGDEIVQSYGLSDPASDYLDSSSVVPSAYAEKISERARDLRRQEERRRQAASERRLHPLTVLTRNEADIPVANMLQSALRALRNADEDMAASRLADARQAAPEYFEVERVTAELHARRDQIAEARRHFERALELCEADENRATVAYHAADFLAKHAHLPEEALPLTRMADEILSSETRYTTLLLGQINMYLGAYDEAEPLFDRVIAYADKSEDNLRIVAVTNRCELDKRRAERLGRSRRRSESTSVALDGAMRAHEVLNSGRYDRKLSRVACECVSEGLRAGYTLAGESDVVGRLVGLLDMAQHWWPEWRHIEEGRHLRRVIENLDSQDDLPDPIRASLAQFAAVADYEREQQERHGGFMKRWPSSDYAFIDADDSDEDVFCHISSLRSKEEQILLVPDVRVSYDLDFDEKGRAEAVDLAVTRDIDELEMLRARRARIVHLNNEYGIAIDSQTQASIYFNLASLEPGLDWGDLQDGQRIECDLEIDHPRPRVVEGGLAAV